MSLTSHEEIDKKLRTGKKIICGIKGHTPTNEYESVDGERCKRTKLCIRCGEIFEVEELPHDFVEKQKSVCETLQVCEKCGHKISLPTTHEFVQETEFERLSTEYDDWDKDVAVAWIMKADFRCTKCGGREQRTERRELG